MKMIKSQLFYFATLLLVVAVVGIVANCQHSANFRVMVVHSYGKNYPNYPAFNHLIESEFRRQGEPVNISFHYLDSEARNHPGETEFIKDLLDHIPPGQEPDLIMPVGDQATYSLLVHQHPMLKRVPVVFMGVEFPNKNVLSHYDNVTGVTDSLDVLENLKVMREILGKRHAFTMMENRILDRMMLRDCNAQLDSVPYVLNNLEWKYTMYYTRSTPDSVLTLTSLSTRSGEKNSAMNVQREALGDENFFFMMRSDQPIYYLQLKADGFSNALLNFTNKEQFTAVYNYFGTDRGRFLAGYFSSMKYQAADGVKVAVRILRGEKPADIPLRNSRKGYFIDWQLYKELGIPIDSVPEKYQLARATFSDYYPHLSLWIYGGVGVIVAGVIGLLIYLVLRERRNRQRILHRSLEDREMMKKAIQSSRTIIWRQHNREITLEEDFWNYVGEEPHLIQVEDFAQYLDSPSRKRYFEEVGQLKSGGEMVTEVRCDFLRNGHYEWWQIRANNQLSSDGSNNKENNKDSYGILINIEDIKQREMELIEARKLAEAAELKESFLANMSHEIRTPLNAIVGFSNILATPGMELSDEEKLEMVATINKNNDLLLKLVNDVLDLSRIESGNIVLTPAPCPVDRVMDYVYQSFLMQAPKRLRFELAKGETGLTMLADEGRVGQVLLNFLTNASKFTPEGYIRLGWQAAADGHEVELYVEDSGIGISKEKQLMVFDRFYKVDEFMQGTGLGLSICKVIAEKMGARLTLESEVNRGSRFSLWVKTAAEEG